MIHDPKVEITCDGTDCNESVYLPMEWSVEGYDLSDSDASELLDSDHYWLTIGESHYCENCKTDQS